MIRLVTVTALLVMFSALPAKAEIKDTTVKKDVVVLLHGIARTGKSLKKLEMALQEEGYETLALTYPSRQKDLDDIAGFIREEHLTEAFWNEAENVHFITHSMGGLVARRYLDIYKPEDSATSKVGRVVMMAPPNGGSEITDMIGGLWGYKQFYGPAGQELSTGTQTNNDDEPYYDLGIIAGTKEWPYPVAAFVIPGKSDGRVAVEKTKLKGMKDHITVAATHSFIMNKPDVHKQVLYFLKNGEFDHAAKETE